MGEQHESSSNNTGLTSKSTGAAKTNSFVDILKGKKTLNPTTIDLSSLPNPTLKEGEPALEIPLDFFQEGCKPFKHSFIARLDFTGVKFPEVKHALVEQWKLGQDVKFLPMRKGFFIIMLATAEEKERIRNGPKAIIKNKVLQIQDWYPSFNPNKQRTSRAAVWVMLPELPMELWTKKSISSIDKSFGTPIVVDEKTLRLEYGYFASVLVDIDFSKHIPERILLKANGREFWQYMDIHKRPQFCAKCSIIGHCEEDCRKKSRNKTKSNQLQEVAAEQIPIMRNDNPPGMEWKVAANKNTGKQV
ncbi:uncharacterized protein LOC113296290 [Papaver somniferum]|uniref:uncharacterized protein LOC113296290 n=1 Tax=Papaver somniferum TaxID=3469 RepID=UPI000E6FC2E0|nr:uncharacterized protein LOC113296290 [Papaver somniferum]